jgi:2-C-methyl-D-erythritol 2,4-cyclodiphosphate synthase
VRVGQGYDVHRFSDDASRPLWLGLVHVDGARGLDGYSDADVATHALCDALLGAAGLGDLGRQFPSTDPAWSGAASSHLLDQTLMVVIAAGYGLVNADVTIVAQHPRLDAHLPAMSGALSRASGAPVSVKATTTDQVGAIGRGEGVAALSIVLREERP